MYPQHTNLSHPTSNPPKPTPNFQPTSTDNSTESSPQSSLPCGQRTPAASTSSSDAPSSQTPPQTFVHPPHQPKIPTHTQHTSPSPHQQHIKTPLKTNAKPSSQSSIVEKDQQRVLKSADDTQVKRSKQHPRQQDKCLCFHCNLPGHLKRNCPEIPYCSICRTKGHTQDRCPTSHRGPDMHAKLANPETNREGMKISHSFQAITISVIRLRIVHNNDELQPLTVLLVVQVLLYTKMHLTPHTPLFILIHNHQLHAVNLPCMYRHQLLT